MTMIAEVRGWVKLHPQQEVSLERLQKDLPNVSEAMIRHTMRELAAENRVTVMKRGRVWQTKGRARVAPADKNPTRMTSPSEESLPHVDPDKLPAPPPTEFDFVGYTKDGGVVIRDNHQNLWIARRM